MLRKIALAILLLLITAIAVLLVVNLTDASEPIPEVEVAHGQEADRSKRPWWEATTVYQVYPRSFQDSDGDGVGDLAGIISRLDYIRELGFETIWFSPFFRSPQKDFGYDVSDYYLPDPQYGDSTLVDSLIREIHRRDMKVVFDLVLNHTSEEHPWFAASRASRDNPRSDWYVWRDGAGEDPPTNWHSALGMNGWHYDPTRGQWYFSSFLSFQPDLNWRNPEVKEAMFEVVRHWLDKGVDGFRLDIFNYIYEDPDFRDNPFSLRVVPTGDFTEMFWQKKAYTMNHPDDFVLAKELRGILDQYDPPGSWWGRSSGTIRPSGTSWVKSRMASTWCSFSIFRTSSGRQIFSGRKSKGSRPFTPTRIPLPMSSAITTAPGALLFSGMTCRRPGPCPCCNSH